MINDLIDYLAAGATNFVSVELAHDTQPIDVSDDTCPAAFVYLDSERFAAGRVLSAVTRDIEKRVHVFIVARHAEIDARRIELRSLAIGWRAGGDYSPLEFESGKVAAIKGEWMWWLDVFTTVTDCRN